MYFLTPLLVLPILRIRSNPQPSVSDEPGPASHSLLGMLQAQRFRYNHLDMAHLDEQLKAANTAGARNKLVVTDGVFSMDGDVAPLKEIIAIARRHDAQVAVDECHATGVLGATGRGTDELAGVLGQV